VFLTNITKDENWEKVKQAWVQGKLIQHQLTSNHWIDYTNKDYINRAGARDWRIAPAVDRYRVILTKTAYSTPFNNMPSNDIPLNDGFLQWWRSNEIEEPGIPNEDLFDNIRIVFVGEWQIAE
jgi:hypothetical protein